MDELTPEQDKALDTVVDLFVTMGKASAQLGEQLTASKVPAPGLPLAIKVIAQKMLAREDLPDMFKMPLPLLQEYLHKMLHLSMDKDEEIEKLK